MWVVRDADSEIYLFGTMHMLKDGADWRTPTFDDAYARAGTVWFEADVSGDPEEARTLMSRYGVDPSRRLTEKRSPRAVRSLRPLLARERIPLEAVDSLRPWAAAMILSVQPLLNRGYRLQSGADAVITANAGCILQIAREARQQGQRLPVYHPMDLLDLSYRGKRLKR